MKQTLKKHSNLICIVILGLLPIISLLVNKIINPVSPSLLTSEWNDELFYFKQVEAIIDHGYPLGYYGFNESHALAFSFAAWSPVLVWPWVILGKIFGWTLTSVFVYNLLIYILALVLFGVFTEPDVKQTAVISVWFLAFFLNVRYIYSCMPEVICFAHMIIFWGLVLGFFKKGKKGYLYAAIFLGSLMTFMRPYLILFLVFALMVLFFGAPKGKRLLKGFISFIILGVTAFIYYLLNHYLSAEYLMPFFYTDFITTFFTDGIGPGFHNLFGTLYYKGSDFIRFMKDAFYIDRAAGIFFCIFMFKMLLETIQCIIEYRAYKKSGVTEAAGSEKAAANEAPETTASSLDKDFFARLYMLFADFAFLMALLLMYKLTEGSKHLLTFIMAGVLVMIMEKKRGYIYGIIMSACVIYFGIFHCTDNFYDFGIPRDNAEADARYDYWQQAFAEGIEIDKTIAPSYGNAIIWEFADNVDGESITTDWQMLYALPSGTGISCCWEYTDENFDTIRCRYISAPSGGDIENMCIEAGYRQIGRDDRLCVYARY